MTARKITAIDRIIGEIGTFFNILAANSPPARAYPAERIAESDQTPRARTEAARLMRVNHAGEVAAQALYRGQALFAHDPAISAALQRAAAEELDHLRWCERRLTELNGRTSLLNPLWYAGSLLIGAAAALAGDATSLGFVTETETQVEAHLADHLGRLDPTDLRSRRVLEAMRDDEVRHGAEAAALGGKPLGATLQRGMQLTARLMTRGSHWL